MKRLPKRRPNSAKPTKSSPVRVTYIGATGSLEAVCKQVFRWNHDEGKGSSDPVLVIVWHEGWTMPGCEHWRELYEELGRATSPIRILVALFDGTPECLKQRSDGSRLSLLFRIIGVNPAHPVGWASITDVARFQSAAIRWEKSDAGLALRLNANKVCGPLGFSERAMAQWDYFAGHQGEARRNLALGDAFCALEGIIELQGQPDVLVFDDLAGFSGATANAPHEKWNRLLAALGRFFRISRPVFPVQQRHAKLPDELLPIVRAEIERLPRPLAAIVDMNWVYADSETEEADPEFGLKLIRLIREAKPTLPIIVWSTVKDKRILQRSLQYGAMFYFDKHKKIAYGQHHEDATDDEHGNFLNRGKLWFHILEWEFNRYQMPPVGKCGDSFLLADTSESKEARRKFLKTFDLTESDLLAEHEPEIERLLRALVPDAEQIEILRFFGEGLSGAERPFVVRGRTASGRWLRPVQIKIGRDRRALAREGKGYRDVFARSLGPSVAHVESGPYRIGGWCGMAQSFAAPEEAIREIATKSTRSLEDWLRKNLWRPDVCKAIVNELFEGLLDPFYKGNIAKSRESVVRAFERVTPAHLEAVFSPAPEKHTPADIDLTPQELSFQNEKARREMACRRWRVAEQWFARKPKEAAQSLVIRGMVIDTLETCGPDVSMKIVSLSPADQFPARSSP